MYAYSLRRCDVDNVECIEGQRWVRPSSVIRLQDIRIETVLLRNSLRRAMQTRIPRNFQALGLEPQIAT